MNEGLGFAISMTSPYKYSDHKKPLQTYGDRFLQITLCQYEYEDKHMLVYF